MKPPARVAAAPRMVGEMKLDSEEAADNAEVEDTCARVSLQLLELLDGDSVVAKAGEDRTGVFLLLVSCLSRLNLEGGSPLLR